MMSSRRLMLALAAILTAVMPLFAQIPEVAEPVEAPADSSAVVNATSEMTIIERINAPGSTVTFEQPQALIDRVINSAEKNQAAVNETETVADEAAEQSEAEKPRVKNYKGVGYRVQIFADNNSRTAKGEARQRERAISQTFPEYGTYVYYDSPYWRLRVGDFRSQYEAEKAAADIRKSFPSYAKEVRVVRDRVNIRQ